MLVDPPSQAELFDGVVVHRERAPEGSRVGVELSLLDAEGAVVASGSDVSESPRLEVQIVENTRVFAGGGEPIVFFGGPPTDSSPSGSACLWHLGRLTCWGDAASFEAGHLQARDVVGPTRVGGQVSVACQASHLGSCWLEVGGEVHCVRTFFRDCEPNSAQGFDNCASGEWPPRLTEPVVVDSPRELRCGGHLFTLFACLRDAAGALECWGGNVLGELGRPPTDPIEVFTADAPVSPEGAPAFESFATGGAHACGIDAAQHLHCWGWNGNGQVGAGADDARPLTEITAVGEVQLVDASSNSTCVITVAGEMYCWGANEAGAIPGGGENVTAPRRVARGDGAVEIAVGTTHTCVRDAAGNVDCWGGNDQGQLGDGTRAARTTPNRVPLPGAAISIASGQRHSCAAVLAMEEGGERLAVYCWGSNFTGELGVEGADGRTPREVPLETGP